MKKRAILVGLFMILTGCSRLSPGELPEPALVLENLGPAPELANETWINTDQPLHLADLRGQVVLLDMWTFG